MFFRFILLGIFSVAILFIFDIFLPKLRLKYKLHRELKIKKQRQEQFKKKMQELEIK